MPGELQVETDELSELSRKTDRCYRNVCSNYKRDINSIKREMENIISRYNEYGSVVSCARGILSSLKEIEYKTEGIEENSQRLVTNTKQAVALYKESEYISKAVLDKGRLSFGKSIKFSGSIGSSNISFKASNELGEKSQEWEGELRIVGGNQAEKFARSESDSAYLEGGILYESIDGKIYKNGELVAEKDYKYIPHEVGGLRATDGNGTLARAYVENKTVYEQIGKQIYKNGVLVPEENYKYVPKEIGGIRETIGRGSYVIVSQTYVEGDNIYQRIGGIIYKNGKEIAVDDYKYIPVEIGGLREVDGKGSFAQGYKEGGNTYVKIGDVIYKNGKEVSKNDYKYVPQEIGGLRETVGGGNYITSELVDLVTNIGKEIGGTAVTLEGEELADYWRNELVEFAELFKGKIPYQYGGEGIQILDPKNPPKNMDCSAFVASIYLTKFGIKLPRTTKEQIKEGIEVSKEELKIGDLIFFDWKDPNTGKRDGIVDHVGIYIGNGQYIDEGGTGEKANVRICNLSNASSSVLAVRRIIQDNGTILNNKLPEVKGDGKSDITPIQKLDSSSEIDKKLYDTSKVYAHEVDLVNQITSVNKEKFKWDIDNFKRIYQGNKETYERISEKTGIPPELIAALHYRESGCNFNTYLHNGQKLGKTTTIVPKGIYFEDFTEAAIDALSRKSSVRDEFQLTFDCNDIAKMMAFAERYNGLGYYNKKRVSPYVYSGTNVYTGGKYVSDGVYDSNTVDKQPGVYILIDAIK